MEIMRESKGNITIAVLAVVVLAVIAVGFYFYKSKENISVDFKSEKTVSTIPSPTTSSSQENSTALENVPEYRPKVVEGINKKRVEMELKVLTLDNNLCALAKRLAEERASSYPKEVTQNVMTDSKYKDYIKDYSSIQQLKFTVNDMFVEAAKEKGQKITFTDDYLVEAYNQTGGAVGSPLGADLTSGCVATSPENVGTKPFAFFVGGIKKN